MATLRERLTRHEGVRLHPYTDTAGKLTIGIGRNLEDTGISYDEAQLMLENDIKRATEHCHTAFPWMAQLSQVRQEVLIEMVFNMGLGGVLTFKNMLAAMERGDYERAAQEMRASQWALQVGLRAKELASAMFTGTTEG